MPQNNLVVWRMDNLVHKSKELEVIFSFCFETKNNYKSRSLFFFVFCTGSAPLFTFYWTCAITHVMLDGRSMLDVRKHVSAVLISMNSLLWNMYQYLKTAQLLLTVYTKSPVAFPRIHDFEEEFTDSHVTDWFIDTVLMLGKVNTDFVLYS